MNQAPTQKFLGPPTGIEEDGRGGGQGTRREGGREEESSDCWANDVQWRLKSCINEGKGWVYEGRLGRRVMKSKGREGRVWEWRGGMEGVNQPPPPSQKAPYMKKMR